MNAALPLPCHARSAGVPMRDRPPRGLFEAFGIELEYMIVDHDSLNIQPLADRVLVDPQGRVVGDVLVDQTCWSNELVNHVIEIKTADPAADLAPVAGQLHRQVQAINQRLDRHHACLMPTAMHPWLAPQRQPVELWAHEGTQIYATFHRIFDCRGHGWVNLQSAHLNLPFADDDQFARLHAAVRVLLPILPALAASSPIMEGRFANCLDQRMEVYRHNARRVPSVSGRVVPERVYKPADYHRHVLGRIYRDLEPLDPAGVLRHEWVNARGAIARFDRSTIEIRVIDVQECPAADLAIAGAVIAAARALVAQQFSDLSQQQRLTTRRLHDILLACIAHADRAIIHDPDFLHALGFTQPSATAGELWQHLIETLIPDHAPWRAALNVITTQGPLARRMLRQLEPGFDSPGLIALYRRLCQCLSENRMLS